MPAARSACASKPATSVIASACAVSSWCHARSRTDAARYSIVPWADSVPADSRAAVASSAGMGSPVSWWRA
ncbi:Uncharacterised protein [Mycobacteroides abscessus subsp. abscessus]|nr:Uncharacterised protein [Mycobacteroides abscessus subsp. abscessus]